MHKTFAHLIHAVDEAYNGDGLVEIMLKSKNTGDGLAEFIYNELSDIIQHRMALRKDELAEAANAMDRARDELTRVAAEVRRFSEGD